MPIYEYICDDCGRQFEISQSINDASLSICTECNGKMRRLISGGSGFILNKPGFRDAVQTRCGKKQTCCGSATPCESPECGDERE